ncbi:MAG TPA: hypothetical protein VHZ50_07585 [Puia sp.]|nr:hypothetical protein [Puia sp.]
MMIRKLSFLALLLICLKSFGQVATDSSTYIYDSVTEDYFADYKNAKLTIDYYFTDGWSTIDRYSYEIIVIDSLFMIAFSSPESDSYKYISYQKKFLLSDLQLDTIKLALKNSKVKQIKNGIPRPDGSAHTKEVLIVKYKKINIAGGMAYANIASFPDSEPEKEIQKSIIEDRKLSSSIGGNYDLLIKTLRKYFVDLVKLKKQSLQIE